METPDETSEKGLLWSGTRAELEAWKSHKRQKAVRFVERGYSVEWFPDGAPFISVYVPQRHYAHRTEIRADIQCYRDPSHYGIHGGRISKLLIRQTRNDILAQVVGAPHEKVKILYNYDRDLDIDRLAIDVVAKDLFDAVLQELN